MADKVFIQHIIDLIDNRITENISLHQLAEESGYSTSHLGRLFSSVTGLPVMAYITRRKLHYALYDIGCGQKILDAALKYGFETHAGFTKACKKHFGYPPSIYRIHTIIARPARMEIIKLKNNISGEKIMKPVIMDTQPFTVIGFTYRHIISDVRFTHDIPFYAETSGMNYWDPLTRLHNLFDKSRYTEYAACFDVESETGEFTYFLGVGVDNPEDHAKIEPDMFETTMSGGLYARFTTPLVEESLYGRAIADIWKTAFDDWLPVSGYEFDESRCDFEYYDE
ncbi:MAG: helix-turn-helix domain-containing protein [Dehalococcoidales bacterium]|nr:helix-turn-helix domain-containing protein [Dehalococcoidales bacterium]